MPQPLQGVRVIDLTHMLAGPFATHQLRLLGAEVIKVESPHSGDAMRWSAGGNATQLSHDFISINSGKRSVAVDLKDRRGVELILEICTSADVLIENFRPGVMERLGLGYDPVSRVNPGIVYCSVSGYGQRGPLRDWPAYDHVVQAVTGMAMMSGDAAQPPVKVGFPVVDTATGMTATIALLAALLTRKNGGAGQYIDVSMLDAAANLMCTQVCASVQNGSTPVRTGNRGFTGSPGCDTFATADGWIALGANTPEQFARLCLILGIDEILTDSELFDPDLFRVGARRGFARARDGLAVRRCLEAAVATRSADELETTLNEAGVPAARLRTLSEFAKGPLQHLAGSVLQLPVMPGYPDGAAALNAGFRTTHDAPGFASACSMLGQDTGETLRELGISQAKIDELMASGVIADSASPSQAGARS